MSSSSGVNYLWKTNDAVWDDTADTADTLQDIKTVGHNRNGFDSVVETDVLRSLYLVSGAVLFGLGSGFTSSSDSLMSGVGWTLHTALVAGARAILATGPRRGDLCVLRRRSYPPP
jgi:hypothetical protein